jgi:hypothetical protein
MIEKLRKSFVCNSLCRRRWSYAPLLAYSEPFPPPYRIKKSLLSMKIFLEVNSILPPFSVGELRKLLHMPDVVPFPVRSWQLK